MFVHVPAARIPPSRLIDKGACWRTDHMWTNANNGSKAASDVSMFDLDLR